MHNDLLLLMAILWAISFLATFVPSKDWFARSGVSLGCVAGIAACVLGIESSQPISSFGFSLGDTPVQFHIDNGGHWLLLFGLIPALCASVLGTTAAEGTARRYWTAGLAITLLGALGVFGLQDSMSFLIAWEVMSVGGAVMILGEGLSKKSGNPMLFMLSLLEVGAVSILLLLLILGNRAGTHNFQGFVHPGSIATPITLLAGLLLLFGFGAKLGILPFYEWFPAAYGSGSGATGVIFSGIVLNAAFYALARGTLQWLSRSGSWVMTVAIIMIVAGVLTAILAIFNAFQEEDWRRMLSLSSAENAGVAVAVLGLSLLFAASGLPAPAGLAWTVCLLHLAAHSLAKSTLFLTADGVYAANGGYFIHQSGILRNSSALLGVGALFATMSLAAMPPQSGFVSEWYVFQTLFQGLQVRVVAARLAVTLAAAGLALVVAVALGTFAKLFGVGLLGDGRMHATGIPKSRCAVVFVLGLCVLGLAVGMPWWMTALRQGSRSLFQTDVADLMKDGWLLVPLSGKFAFISPTKLMIAGPLLALIPVVLVWISKQRFPMRRAPLWSGGRIEDPRRIATTSLAFSNALRTFYSFIYGPTHNLEREYDHGPYFITRLIFNQEVAPIFGPYLFSPISRFVQRLARAVSVLQSGYLNFYNALIGILLILILGVALVFR